MFSAMSDSLLNHGAKIVQTEWNVKEKLVFLFISEVPPILDCGAKVQRKTIGSPICPTARDQFSHGLLHFSVYQCVTKPNFGALKIEIIVYC